MVDNFPAVIRKNGPKSKSITIPAAIAPNYEIGETVKVQLEKASDKKPKHTP